MRTGKSLLAGLVAGTVAALLVSGTASASPTSQVTADQADRMSSVLTSAGVTSQLETNVVTSGRTDVHQSKPAAAVTTEGGTKLGVSLAGASAPGSVEKNGAHLYKGVARDVDAAVLSENGTVQFVTILNTERAGSTQRYSLDLPAGTHLEAVGSGFFIVDGKAIVGVIAAPWAKDASGRSLSTSYTVDGSTLVQHINTQDAQYPIVADPKISYGWYVYIRFNPLERREISLAVGAAGGAIGSGIICAEGGPLAVILCGAVGGVAAAVIFEFVYDSRSNRPECGLEVRFRAGIEGWRLIQGDSDRNC